jgi:hypothetical protein
MLIGYGQPSDIAWTIHGTGAAFVTASSYLSDGRPGLPTRITWLSGAQTTARYLTLRAEWSDALDVRVLALVGVTLPVGTKIAVSVDEGSPSAPITFAYTPRVVRFPGGSRGVFIAIPEAQVSPVTAVEIHIYNDVNGVASIAAGASIDIGEAFVGAAYDVPIRPSPTWKPNDPSLTRRSESSQPWPVTRLPFRTFACEIVPRTEDQAWGTLDELVADIGGAQPIVVIPSERDENQALDPALMNRFAIYGYAVQLPDITALERRRFQAAQLVVDEAPASPVT